MRIRFLFWQLTGLGLFLFLGNSCKKDVITLPQLSTTPLSEISSSSITCGGTVTSEGGSVVSARGVCWSTSFNPTIHDNITTDGTGAGSYVSSISGLENGTNYYVRAYATNNIGTAYGNEFVVITPVTDVDGNVYKTGFIGTQVWMTENLKTTKYNDNTPIPLVTDDQTWGGLFTPAYCWYGNNQEKYKGYGALYNWYAVNTGNLCPAGWHVPSETEWTDMTNFVGGVYIAGGRLKELGLIHWREENIGATNDFGFTAIPGGYRSIAIPRPFRTLGYYAFWWASTESDFYRARARLITYDAAEVQTGTGLKKNGYSIRCVKN